MNLYERLLGRPLLKIGAKSKFHNEFRQHSIKGSQAAVFSKIFNDKQMVDGGRKEKGEKFAGEPVGETAFIYPVDKENLEVRA